MDPPIHTEYLRSGGATILTCMACIRIRPRKAQGISYLHAGWGQRSKLLLHTVSDTGEHGGSSRKHNVAVEITTDIEITLEDRIVAGSHISDRRLIKGSKNTLTLSREYRGLQDRGSWVQREPQGHGTCKVVRPPQHHFGMSLTARCQW